MKRLILALPLLIALSHAATAQTTGPAVAQPNGEISTAAGVINDDTRAIIAGKFAIPLSHSFGAQIDASQIVGEGTDRGGFGGHVFYRDPQKYLLGMTGMWSRISSEDLYRAGPEAELYIKDVSFRVSGGWQHGFDETTGYGNAKVTYYPMDNLSLAVRGEAFSSVRSAGVEVEYQPSEKPFTVFATGGDSNNSDGTYLAGLRFTFGAPGTSLKQRHREYDPVNIVDSFNMNEGASAIGKYSQPAAQICVPDYCGAPGGDPACCIAQ